MSRKKKQSSIKRKPSMRDTLRERDFKITLEKRAAKNSVAPRMITSI
jgi:hypothetical protein